MKTEQNCGFPKIGKRPYCSRFRRTKNRIIEGAYDTIARQDSLFQHIFLVAHSSMIRLSGGIDLLDFGDIYCNGVYVAIDDFVL